MTYKVSDDCSYTLYGGVAISYAYEPHPKGMITPHFHKDYELFLLLKGNRKFFCSNRICSLSPATAMLVEPHEYHQGTTNLDSTSERYAVYVSPQLMETILKENRELPTPKTVTRFELDNDTFSKVLEHIKEIQQESRKKDIYSKSAVKNHITAVLIHVFRNVCDTATADSNFERNDMRLQSTVDYIIKNYNTKITLEECAEMAYMSVSHFSRQFRLITGVNFKEFLNRVRIEKACELLKSGKYRNKTAIAQEVGFSSSSYFTYVFRNHTGVSPTQYQKNSPTQYQKNAT